MSTYDILGYQESRSQCRSRLVPAGAPALAPAGPGRRGQSPWPCLHWRLGFIHTGSASASAPRPPPGGSGRRRGCSTDSEAQLASATPGLSRTASGGGPKPELVIEMTLLRRLHCDSESDRHESLTVTVTAKVSVTEAAAGDGPSRWPPLGTVGQLDSLAGQPSFSSVPTYLESDCRSPTTHDRGKLGNTLPQPPYRG